VSLGAPLAVAIPSTILLASLGADDAEPRSASARRSPRRDGSLRLAGAKPPGTGWAWSRR